MTHYILKYKDIIGKKFGRLTPIEVVLKTGNGVGLICKCDCGTVCTKPARMIKRGDVRSCGCITRQHGQCSTLTKYPTEYYSWGAMRDRCNNKNSKDYSRYGGRGITVCARWSRYREFYEDMGKKPSPIHTIDRINNNGNYEPSNCKWSTPTEQSNNRRELKNKIHEKSCEVCKTIYKPHSAKSKYCSHTCHGMTRKGKKLSWLHED